MRNVLQGWLRHEDCLQEHGEGAYFDDPHDLVALRPAAGEDRLSQLLRNHFGWLFKVISPWVEYWVRLMPNVEEARCRSTALGGGTILVREAHRKSCRCVERRRRHVSVGWCYHVSLFRLRSWKEIGPRCCIYDGFRRQCELLVYSWKDRSVCSDSSVGQAKFKVRGVSLTSDSYAAVLVVFISGNLASPTTSLSDVLHAVDVYYNKNHRA